MKMTSGVSLAPRFPRRAAKRQSSGKNRPVPEELRASVDPCENSSDSGLGFDQHLEYHQFNQFNARQSQNLAFLGQENWYEDQPDLKRRRLDIKIESDDANDFCFQETMRVKGPSDPSRLVPEQLLRTMGSREGREAREGRVNHGVVGRPLTRAAGQAHGIPPGAALPLTPLTPLTSLTTLGRRGGAGGAVQGAGTTGASPPTLPPAMVTLTSQLGSVSRDGRVQLQIVCQPETQHRARYQTEGSRGAVKDRSGNGFPVVKLSGYNKSTTLQVFIGTDQGRVAPHMFYQACRVCGKNSTPCVEKKVDGTVVIEVDFEPSKEMTVTCDCVGILKERNVDVEHRFPDQSTSRSKKKSTRCRMVFRATIVNEDGTQEILQVTSQPIVCTQPPGVPEICKKSLTSAPCTGGMELFIIGKNFLKDTRVIFLKEEEDCHWKEIVIPDKEYLQQTHLVCTVPAFHCPGGNLSEAMSVRLLVESGGKASEAHTFLYTSPTIPATPAMQVGSTDVAKCCTSSSETGLSPVLEMNRSYSTPSLMVTGGPSMSNPVPVAVPGPSIPSSIIMPYGSVNMASSHGSTPSKEDIHPSMLWPSGSVLKEEKAKDLMPPPTSMALPRRPSLSHVPDALPTLKTEVLDEPLMTSMANTVMSAPVITPPVLSASMPPPPPPSAEHLHGVDLRMSSMKGPSMATLQQFIMRPSESVCSLPTQSGQSVETFLNRLECDKMILEHQRQEQQPAQQQERSPQRSPLEPLKSPSHQEQGMAMSLQVQSMLEQPQSEPFLSSPSRPGPSSIIPQMDNMLVYSTPVTTQDLFVSRPSAPIDTSPYLPSVCNTSPIAQKSIMNSESPTQFSREPIHHDENSNHATEMKSTHHHFSTHPSTTMSHMLHTEQTRAQMAHLMHEESSNHAQIAQILDEASKDASQMSQVINDERSNHGVDVKVPAAQLSWQDERSNHDLDVKTSAVQQLAEILHDSRSNHGIDVQTSTAQQFAQMLREDHSNHSRDVKTSLAQSFNRMIHDESSNHPMENKSPSSQDISQMIANRENQQQLAHMLHGEASNHAVDVKTSTAQQIAQILHDEASNAALMAQEEQHNKAQSHLSFSQIFRGEHSNVTMNPSQQNFVSLHQGNPSHSSELKSYCSDASADPLLAISNAQVSSLLPSDNTSLVITQAPSNEQLQVNCITTPSCSTKDKPLGISPVYSQAEVSMQAQVEAQVQAHVQAQVEAQVQVQMQVQAQMQAQAEAQMQAQAQVQMQVEAQAQAQAEAQSQSQSQSSPHQMRGAGVMDYPILTTTLASGKLYAAEVQQQQQQQQHQSQSVQQQSSKPHGDFPEIFDIFQNQ